MIGGLYYPLTVTPSGDVQIAFTSTEDLVQSWIRYILDTEQPFDLFEPVGSAATAEGLEKFSYSLRTKVPLVQFAIQSRWDARTLLIEISWTESGNQATTTVGVQFN